MKSSAPIGLVVTAFVACGGLIESTATSHREGSSSGAAPLAPPRDASVDVSHPPEADAARAPADGVCTSTSVSQGRFDPDCVYLLGTVTPGTVGGEVLIDMRQPADRAFGLGYIGYAPIVRPTDGRLFFVAHADQTSNRIYQFASGSPGTGPASLAGHTAIATNPSCDPDQLGQIFIFPDDGALLYECGGTYYIAGSPEPFALLASTPVAVGRNRLVIATNTYPSISLQQGGVTRSVPGLTGRPFAFRSRPSGTMWMATDGTGVRGELREIAVDGTMAILGAYEFGAFGPGPECVLEPSGALVCITRVGPGAEGVVRFTLTSPPDILHDESMSDVKLHVSHLVTGP